VPRILLLNRTDRTAFIEAFIIWAQQSNVDLELHATEEIEGGPLLHFAESVGFGQSLVVSVVPKVNHDEYPAWVETYCVAHGIDFVFSTGDQDIIFLSAHRNKLLDCGVKVLPNDLDRLSTVMDKSAYCNSFRSSGIETVPTLVLRKGIELGEVQRAVGPPPYVVKPRIGQGSMNFEFIADKEDLLSKVKFDPDFVIQPFLAGDAYTVDVLGNEVGDDCLVFPRQRKFVLGSKSVVTEATKESGFVEVCRRLAVSIGLAGPYNFQLIRDVESGKVYLHDINPRIASGTLLSIASGMPTFHWLANYSIGKQSKFEEVQLDRSGTMSSHTKYKFSYAP